MPRKRRENIIYRGFKIILPENSYRKWWREIHEEGLKLEGKADRLGGNLRISRINQLEESLESGEKQVD